MTTDGGKIWYGGELKIPKCKKNVGQYLLDAMLANKDRIAQIDPIKNTILTHGEIRQLSIRCALRMRCRGLKKGDVIIVCGRHQQLLPIPILGAMYLGVTVCTLHPDYSTNEIRSMVKITQPRAIVCDGDMEPKFVEICEAENLPVLKIISFQNEFYTRDIFQPTAHEDIFVAEKLDPNETDVFICPTSGTTGLIKGVTVTHTALWIGIMNGDIVKDEDRLYVSYTPMSWVTGLLVLLSVLLRGSKKLCCEYDPDRNIEILLKYKVDWIYNSAAKMLEIINHPEFKKHPEIAHNIKNCIFGGSITTKEQFLRYQKIFKNADVVNGYGSTEVMGPHATFISSPELSAKKVNSQGIVPNGCSWKVVNIETGKSVGNNQVGELWIKAPSLTKGYYKNPEATAKAIDQEGYFHSGDLVIIDDDDCLFIVDRCKELFKYKGWQVSPAELENVLLSHPEVIEACVIGLPGEEGDLPTAVVVKQPSSTLSEEGLKKFVNDQVSDVQKLRGGLKFVTELPKNPVGKVQRRRVEELFK